MSEPTLTGQFKALVARHGSIELALAGLRHYWKLIVGTAGVIFAFGVFLDKFNTVIETQKRQIDAQKQQTDAITALTIRVGAVEQSEQNRSILEKAIGEAAKITVTPIVPESPSNAPAQEARQGKVIR